MAAVSPVVKGPEGNAYHSHSSSSEVKNIGRYTFIFPYILIVLYLITNNY
jgi:hypothetical protein